MRGIFCEPEARNTPTIDAIEIVILKIGDGVVFIVFIVFFFYGLATRNTGQNCYLVVFRSLFGE